MKYVLGTVAAAVIAFAQTSMAQPPSSAIGVVIMHGKGGSPARHVSSLASSLEQKGYLVANLEMPWSANREYNAGVDVAYLSWFDPEGAMNQVKASRAMNPQVPVLFIAPKNDYPGLLKVKQAMFDALPRNPLTRMYEPDSSHLDAPFASRDEIVRWTTEVADTSSPALGNVRK